MKNWKLQKVDHTLTNKLASDLNVSKDIAKLLILRGVDSFIAAKNFFRPDLKNVHDPFLMKGMKDAVNRINRAKSQNESILLFGDYDVDGTSAVSRFYSFFKDNLNDFRNRIEEKPIEINDTIIKQMLSKQTYIKLDLNSTYHYKDLFKKK